MTSWFDRITRAVWGSMLWAMRRPWIRKLQRKGTTFMPEGRWRDRARQTYLRQERFARKYGLGLLRLCIKFVLAVWVFGIGYVALYYAFEQGWIPQKVPDTSSPNTGSRNVQSYSSSPQTAGD